MSSVMVRLDPDNAIAMWIRWAAKTGVPHLTLGLRMAPMKEKHVLRYWPLLSWCNNMLGLVCVPHEVMVVVASYGMWRRTSPLL